MSRVNQAIQAFFFFFFFFLTEGGKREKGLNIRSQVKL